MHTIKHTLILSGSYYFNLRVPREAQHLYGGLIRFKLGSTCPSERGYPTLDEVRVIVGKLTSLLYDSFDTGHKIDYKTTTAALKPKKLRLTDFMEEYVSVKEIHAKPSQIAVATFISIAGDREVADYHRDDARAFLSHLRGRGVATATIRRRIGSIAAILNYAYAELDIDRRNRFSKIIIPGEGRDAVKKRGA